MTPISCKCHECVTGNLFDCKVYNQKLWPTGFAQKHSLNVSKINRTAQQAKEKINQRALQAKEKVKSLIDRKQPKKTNEEPVTENNEENNEKPVIASNIVEKVNEPVLTEIPFEEDAEVLQKLDLKLGLNENFVLPSDFEVCRQFHVEGKDYSNFIIDDYIVQLQNHVAGKNCLLLGPTDIQTIWCGQENFTNQNFRELTSFIYQKMASAGLSQIKNVVFVMRSDSNMKHRKSLNDPMAKNTDKTPIDLTSESPINDKLAKRSTCVSPVVRPRREVQGHFISASLDIESGKVLCFDSCKPAGTNVNSLVLFSVDAVEITVAAVNDTIRAINGMPDKEISMSKAVLTRAQSPASNDCGPLSLCYAECMVRNGAEMAALLQYDDVIVAEIRKYHQYMTQTKDEKSIKCIQFTIRLVSQII